MKQVIAGIVVSVALILISGSNAFAAGNLTSATGNQVNAKSQLTNQLTQGVFSEGIMNEVGKLMEEFKQKHPKTTDDEMVKAVAERIATLYMNSKNKRQNDVGAQSASDYLPIAGSLGPTEKQVFDSNPVAGGYVLADAKLASDSAASKYPDSLHNGIGDAYRHGLWQALSAFHTGVDYAKKFGDAHEKDFPNPEPERTMDYTNNAVGRTIGSQKWFIWTVYSGVQEGINNGRFVYIKNGRLVPTNK